MGLLSLFWGSIEYEGVSGIFQEFKRDLLGGLSSVSHGLRDVLESLRGFENISGSFGEYHGFSRMFEGFQKRFAGLNGIK